MWGKAEWSSFLTAAWKQVVRSSLLQFNNQWGGRGKSGHGDYLLSPWPGKGGAIGSTLHLTSGDFLEPSGVVVKIFTNSPYLPQGSFSLPYLDITHSFSRWVTHPIPTGTAAPKLAAPLFFHTDHLVMWKGWQGVNSLFIPLRSVIGKLWRGPLPVRSSATDGSSLFHPSSLRRELTEWGVA